MPVFTEEQERAIETKGNLLVSAAAGAGKTAVMTERIARLIASGVKVDELLVVTFTRAAAAEMKQRIESKLNSLADEETDEAKKLHLYDAAADIGSANISTIHSFCSDVLRRNAHEAGIDPAFRVADDSEAVIMQAEALDEVLEAAYAAAEKDPGNEFNSLIRCLRDDETEQLILDTYSYIIARPDPLSFLARAATAYDEEFDESFDSASEELMNGLRRSIHSMYLDADKLAEELSYEGDIGLKYLDTVHKYAADLLNFANSAGYDEVHRKLDGYSLPRLPRKAKGEEIPDNVERYRKSIKDFVDKLKADFGLSREEERKLAKAYRPCMGALYSLTEAFMAAYAEKKRNAAVIDFNDMEQFTYEVLKDERIAEEYRAKFSYIFVDEYQDTNPVQDAVIASVARGDNLFMVGDVKQSIYRFRQAEPANFLDKYERYKDGVSGTRIELNRNFRSKAAVIEATNTVFSEVMRGGIGEIDYSRGAALRPGGEAEGGCAELMLISLGEDEEKEDEDEPETYERAEAEALAAASEIRRIMDSSMVFDKQLGRMRRCAYSDFAVLMRRTTGAALSWVNTLSACGIPCVAALSEGFYDAVEVQIFINLLRIIDNRRQDVPLMSVLRSPIVGLTSGEAVLLRTKYSDRTKKTELLDAVIAASEANEEGCGRKCRKLLSDIEVWREFVRRSGVEALISRLISETNYYSFLGVLPGGTVRQANLMKLVDRAHFYESSQRNGLHGFIRMLDMMNERGKEGAAQQMSVDAVRVMSVHKSKGLEFPVVFLAGITGRFSTRASSDTAVFDPELGVGLRLKAFGESGSLPIIRRAIKLREDYRQREEEKRILYVGMTRARERLIMLGADKQMNRKLAEYASPLTDRRILEARSYLDWMIGSFFPLGLSLDAARKGVVTILGTEKLHTKLLSVNSLRNSGIIGGKLDESAYIEWTERARALPHDELSALLNYTYPFIGAAVTNAKRSVTDYEKSEYEYSPAVPNFMRENRELTAAERGTAMHKTVMHLPLGLLTEAEIKEKVRELRERGILSAEEADSIRINNLNKLVRSELWQRMTASERAERELEFTLRNEDGSLVQGIIDCCFIEDGAWVIVDYKTNYVGDNDPREIAERYIPQLTGYENALKSITGIPVGEKWIYLLSAGLAVKIGNG